MARRRPHYDRYPTDTGGLGHMTHAEAEQAHAAARQFGYSTPQGLSRQQQTDLRNQVQQALADPNTALDRLTDIMRRHPDLLTTVPGLAQQLQQNPAFQNIRDQLIERLQTPDPAASGTQAMDGQMTNGPSQQQALVRHLQALSPRVHDGSMTHDTEHRRLPGNRM